ncbi:epoxide hydrolase 4 isoform X3 [Megalobrama amblycephala]|uniref:epoxide hydrolase 4 isoform X3 n=1 Tax=Megalobrama amblycephala TaxID=75352 RepID=UPI0020142B35|nr:epoxide hydrolase 4 isoform X3 [Megalobrama amblycephala]XP_048055561.1 epoxide hydrolase 4 isoform X3 [Megalobrama amblycephala]
MARLLHNLLLLTVALTLKIRVMGYWSLIYGYCALCTGVALLKLGWNIILRPSTTFQWTVRETPPACLNDTSLGTHCYVRIKKAVTMSEHQFSTIWVDSSVISFPQNDCLDFAVHPSSAENISLGSLKIAVMRALNIVFKCEESGLRFHYVAAGERGKPLMLFLHGFPEFWFSWRHQLREFKSEFRVVAVDMRGYGESDLPSSTESYRLDYLVTDIKDIVEYLGYNRCFLVGHDWGGIIAWLCAIHYPEMVTKLIVLNSPHPCVFTGIISMICIIHNEILWLGPGNHGALPSICLVHSSLEEEIMPFVTPVRCSSQVTTFSSSCHISQS